MKEFVDKFKADFIPKDNATTQIPFNDGDGETFSEIGTPLRQKRQVAFPEDDAMDQNEDKVERVEGDGPVDGRALKQSLQSVTKIDVGVQSQLLVTPGSTAIIYFDVTNLRAEPSMHNFNVQDEKRFLLGMEPRL